MRIPVFGATGRTGRPLVAQALDRGHEVVAFARDAAAHVEDVRASDRAWTVVRAPRLTEDERSAYRAGTDLRPGLRDSAARATVAAFVLDCLAEERSVHELPTVADA